MTSHRTPKLPIVEAGILGWSNKRGGTEFYARPGGRWGGTDGPGRPDGWGDLLTDKLEAAGAHEGAPVVVVALDRFTTMGDLEAVAERVREAVNDWSAATGPGRAKCSCGELSDVLPTGAARKRWHREHKQQIVAQMAADEGVTS